MTLTDKHPAQVFALVVGVIYLALGLVGFLVTGFGGLVENGPAALFSFDLNPFHNIVHIAVGLILIGSSIPQDAAITQGVLIGGGLAYILVAFLGFINHMQLLSVNNSLAPDNFLHIVSGVLAVTVGLLGAQEPGVTRGQPEADTLAGPTGPTTPRPPLTRS
jgi:Domain of unknown function (DUF4383)